MTATERHPLVPSILWGIAGLILTPVGLWLIWGTILWPRESFSEEGEGFLMVLAAMYTAPVGAVYWAVAGWISAYAKKPGRVFLITLAVFVALCVAGLLLLMAFDIA